MFNNMFRSISRQFDKGQNQNEPPGSYNSEQDRIDDDFLLVGDTASERTTIRAADFRASEIDAPPNYKDVSDGHHLPSYQDYRSNTNAYMSPTINVAQHPGLPHGNPMQTGTATIPTAQPYHSDTSENHFSGSENINTNRTAISDIPFLLGCGAGSCSVLQEIKMNNLLMQKTFDFSNYEYDFTTEMAILRENEAYEEEMAMETS